MKPNEKILLLISSLEFHIEKLDAIKAIMDSKYSSAIPAESLFELKDALSDILTKENQDEFINNEVLT